MASNINYNSIDETFPIAGRDNDSQGFRDNFSVVKNNFEAAKSEIEDLQLNAARLDDANNFNGNTLSNLNLSSYSEEVYLGGYAQGTNTGVSSTTLIEINNGPYQVFTVNPAASTLQFTVTGLTQYDNKLAKLTVQLYKGPAFAGDVTVNFVFNGAGEIKTGKDFPDPIILSTNPATSTNIAVGTVQKDEVDHTLSPIIFEFWSYNGGYTVFCDYRGQFS
jgi:hypothetical protein